MSSQTSTTVGVVVAILIIGAIATLGYYQFDVAAKQTTTSSTSTAPAVTCPSAQCANVTIESGAGTPPPGYTGGKTTYGYTPDVVTVVIGKNNTVFWTNDDSTGAPHTVTSDAGDSVQFDSGMTGPLTTQGGTFQFTFTTPGTYTYHCSFHARMQGTVKVLAGSGSSTNSSATSSTTASSG